MFSDYDGSDANGNVTQDGKVLMLLNAWDSVSFIGNGGMEDRTIDGFMVAGYGPNKGSLRNASYLHNAFFNNNMTDRENWVIVPPDAKEDEIRQIKTTTDDEIRQVMAWYAHDQISDIVRYAYTKYTKGSAAGDGNCMYRSLAFLRYGDEKHHGRVRRELCDFLDTLLNDGPDTDELRDKFIEQMDIIDADKRNTVSQLVQKNGNTYDCTDCRTDGKWGNDYTLALSCAVYNVGIVVLRKANNVDSAICMFRNSTPENIYWLYYNGIHYIPMVPRTAPKPAPGTPTLTPEQEMKLQSAWALGGDENEELVSDQISNLAIIRRNARTLRGTAWLDEGVVNFYLMLLQREYQGIHCFSTFFYVKLSSDGYDGVKRWTNAYRVLDCDVIFVPINVGDIHWVLAVIWPKLKKMAYLDSMINLVKSDKGGMDVLGKLAEYLNRESLDKRPDIKDFDAKTWESVVVRCSSRVPV